jgi:hypothetical protein
MYRCSPTATRNRFPWNRTFLEHAADGIQNGQTDQISTQQPRRSDAWPNPIGDAAIRGLAGDVVNLIAPQSESDPAALLIQFLTLFGNCVGQKPYFKVESTKHHANLFSLIVGQTSKARKGTSFDNIADLFEAASPAWSQNCKNTGLSSGEGLIATVSKEVDKNVPADKRLFIYEPEFAKVLQVQRRNGNTLSPTMRAAWDGKPMQIMTKNSPVKSTDAHVSIIGHITQDELRRELTATDQANGYANRLLFVCAKRSKRLAEGGHVDAKEFGRLAKCLTETRNTAKNITEMKRSKAARKMWRKWYDGLNELPGMLGAITSRAEAQVLRLSLIYALLDSSNVIRAHHLQAALAVWNYCHASASYIFRSKVGDLTADKIYEALVNAGKDGMSRTDIRGLFSRNLSEEQTNQALDLLACSGLIKNRKEQSTKGRPTQMWYATLAI